MRASSVQRQVRRVRRAGRARFRRLGLLLVGLLSGGLVLSGCDLTSPADPDSSPADVLPRRVDCPLPLQEQLEDLGVAVDGEVRVETDDNPDPDSPLGRAEGVGFSCEARTDDGRVSVELVATSAPPDAQTPNALELFLPAIQDELSLGDDELAALADDIGPDPALGRAVDLGEEARIAFVPIDVDEAVTAGVVVTSDVLEPDEVRSLAESLAATFA